jgi:hypothetical protein
MRVVVGQLRSAQALAARPAVIPIGRPRAASKKAGLRYEREVARVLPGPAWHGKWFQFEDGLGRAFCQPDLLVAWSGHIIVIECKYTWVPEAAEKLRGLYLPVVAKAMGKTAVGLVVCKKLGKAPSSTPIFAGFEEAIRASVEGQLPVLHWIGVGMLAA